jgi:hypothetical protein
MGFATVLRACAHPQPQERRRAARQRRKKQQQQRQQTRKQTQTQKQKQHAAATGLGSWCAQKPQQHLSVGEVCEVKIVSGCNKGEWAPCRLTSRGDTAKTFDIHIFANSEAKEGPARNVDVRHLRARAQPVNTRRGDAARRRQGTPATRKKKQQQQEQQQQEQEQEWRELELEQEQQKQKQQRQQRAPRSSRYWSGSPRDNEPNLLNPSRWY